MKRSTLSLITASLFVAAPRIALGDELRFYLTTERVFAPGETAQVKVEARDVSSLEMRVYRIADPEAYFDAQRDLHRPREALQAPRPTAASLLRRGAQKGLGRKLAELRRELDAPGREAMRSALPELHREALAGADPVRPERSVPLLEGHTLVELWQEAVGEEGGWSYGIIDVPVREPGAYLVEGVAGDQAAHTVLLISEVALVTKQSASKLLVWAVDPASGDPRPETRVKVLVRGEVKGTKRTGRDGLATFELGLTSEPVIYGVRGESFTLLDPRFFPANLQEPRVYVYTERPVYRPGQTVFVKGFAREVVDERYVIPAAAASGEMKARLSVLDPRGQAYGALVAPVSARGSFEAELKLPDEPAHGTWTVLAEVGGRSHAGEFEVKAFVKPEVRLEVRVGDKLVRAGARVEGDVVGSYFFGAPYPGAEVKIAVTRTRFVVPWWVDAAYGWYYSEAEHRSTRREVVEESTCTLDERGACGFAFETEAGALDYTYVVEAVAADPGGRAVVGQAKVQVTRGAFRLSLEQPALVVAPGDAQELVVRAEDHGKNPVSTEVRVVVSGQHLGRDGVIERVQVLDQKVRTDAAGRAVVKVKPSRNGYYQVRAEARDEAGTELEAEGFLFASDGGGVALAPGDLEVVTDKRSYFAGDTALVLVLAPSPEARVLFTVEGGELYRSEVLETRGHAALVKVEIGAKQTPNFYLSAVAVAGGQIFTRSRSVVVPPRERLLQVEVLAEPPQAQPGDTVELVVEVKDWRGKAVPGAEVALGVVDEAIYAITPEIAVPLEAFFYHRKRNDVRTADSLSFRFFGASRRAGEERASRARPSPWAFGSMKPQEEDRKLFQDTAGWFPSLVTGSEGRASAKLVMPDNLTSWRATARVVSPDTAVGTGTGKVVVKKPLMVRVAMPSLLVEGDAGEGALLVQNLGEQAGTFELELGFEAASGGPSARLEVRFGAAEVPAPVRVAAGATERVPFRWKALEAGEVRLVARARGNGQADGLVARLQVAPWASMRRVSAAGRTSAERAVAAHVLELPAGARGAEAQLRVELFRGAWAVTEASLPYLVGFPYGCTEQTLSRFLPLLVAKTAVDRHGMAPPEALKELPAQVAAGLARLSKLQHEDGGWGWWEEGEGDPWMTAWVLEGFGEAKAAGVEVDEGVRSRGVTALEKRLASGKLAAHERAFALAALSRHGVHKPAMLERLLREPGSKELRASALAHVALAAAAANKKELLDEARPRLLGLVSRSDDGELAWWGEGSPSRAEDHPLEATALALRALLAAGEQGETIAAAERFLLGAFDDERFGTTRQTALVLRALLESLRPGSGEAASFVVRVNGREVASHRFEAGAPSLVSLRPAARLGEGPVWVEVVQTGGAPHHHTVSLAAPERVATFAAVANGGLKIKRTYRALAGAAGAYSAGKAGERFSAGDPVLVTLEVEAAQPVSHFFLEDLRPAGLAAIQRDGGHQVEGVDLRLPGGHREHRDDRTVFFLGRLPAGKTKLSYLARATLPGSFRALPARAEAMYLPGRHFGRSASAALEVRGK